MSRLIDADKYRKDLLSAYDDVSMEFEVLDRQPLVQVIPLDKVRAEIEAQEKWLAEAGYNAYNVGVAFFAIKRALEK